MSVSNWSRRTNFLVHYWASNTVPLPTKMCYLHNPVITLESSKLIKKKIFFCHYWALFSEERACQNNFFVTLGSTFSTELQFQVSICSEKKSLLAFFELILFRKFHFFNQFPLRPKNIWYKFQDNPNKSFLSHFLGTPCPQSNLLVDCPLIHFHTKKKHYNFQFLIHHNHSEVSATSTQSD